MSEINYYENVFARNYDKFTTGGYYDYSKEVEEFKKIVSGKHLLELGIGTGCLAELLIKEGYKIEGIEPSDFMIKELEKKRLGIKVYKQDAAYFDTGKEYDCIFSHGAMPMAVLREKLEFDFYILEDSQLKSLAKKAYMHIKEGGAYLCGVQSGVNDNTSVGDFYRNESRREGNTLSKTHYFREDEKWFSQTVKHRVLSEEEYVSLMESAGFKRIGFNDSKTWYSFVK